MKPLKKYTYERYAILCQMAYPDGSEYEIEQGDYHQIEILDRFKTSCVRIIWQDKKKEVVVVFRGSHNVYDWLLNCCMFFKKMKSPNGDYRLHWGMVKLLQQPAYYSEELNKHKLSDALTNTLEPLMVEGKKVSFIGHSTGGAMAVIYAQQFAEHYKNRIKRVVTFGQPSCGAKSFFNRYALHKKTYRICCDVDMVTFLPPLPGMYHHVGKQLWLHEGKIYDDIKPSQRLVISLKSWLLRPLTYHYMNKYIRNKTLFDEH